MNHGMKGRARGFEPPNSGATSRCLNHLATPAASVRIYQSAPQALRTSSVHRRWSPATAIAMALLLGGSVTALAVTNPTKEEYGAHAGTQLVGLATDELCSQRTLPLVLQLWIKDCPRLIADQEAALASLANQFTRRWNLGVASVFVTTVGGQDLLPTLRLPRYSVTTLGVAGRFLVLQTQSDSGDLE